jgi:hypothetical protein
VAPPVASIVRDRDGREYTLTDELAAGGDGRVMRTEHPRVLVKLRSDGERDGIDEIFRADLDGLAVTRPAALLAPPARGYVMHLVQDAEPLEALMRPSGMAAAAVGEWYAETGGARRRLRALGALASAMASLHGRGVCVCDVSPRNVLIPISASEQPAWLIDPDNLHEPDAVEVTRFTRPWVAPEVYRMDSPCSMRSDVYALALMTLEILTLWFPLFGDRIHSGAPELEEPALAGRLPWIHDHEDASNAVAGAPPAAELLGTELEALARRALEAGRLDPAARPTAAAWAGALHREADRSVRCGAHACGAWCAGHMVRCICCGGSLERPVAILRVVGSDPDRPQQVAIPAGSSRLLRRHFCTGAIGPGDSSPVLEVTARGGGLRVEQIASGAFEVEPGGYLVPGVPHKIPRGAAASLTLSGGRRVEVIWA